jgi:O-succinylbenzoic acid--CoA ligase
MALSVFAAAREAPDAPALATEAELLGYGELAERVRRVVVWLRARGLVGEEAVGVVAGNDASTIVLLHALIAVGTPALLLHPRHTATERSTLVREIGARAVLEPGPDPTDPPRRIDEPGRSPGADASPPGRSPHPPGPGDPAPPPADERPLAIVPTSGTSGRPKGVVLARRAFAAAARASAANLGWRPEDRWLLTLPLAHVGGLSILTRCLLARRCVVLASGGDPDTILRTLDRHRATLASLVPTVLSRILEPDPPPAPPPFLRAVLLGGAAATPALLERAADVGWPVLTTYGLSEACSQATTQRYGTVNRGQLGSGAPLPGVDLRIGDDDHIQLRGPTLFSGYVPAPGAPFLEGGWFDTGDRGRIDDRGNLHVLGRRTDRIVTGGENVDPVEVERAAVALPGIGAACVFGVPDPEWGDLVAAAVVPADPAADPASVAAALRSLGSVLAPFKRPRLFAVLDRLPVNANGKVDRAATARAAAGLLRAL